MTDAMESLLNKWKPANRVGVFGAVLTGMKICGFRGLVMDSTLEFLSPITVLSGLNGAGKSTVLQLAACGFKAVSGRPVDRQYIKDYFPVTQCDPSPPFSSGAYVEYHYEIPSQAGSGGVAPEKRTVTVRRTNSEWSGYKRQPPKDVKYMGMSFYLPKVEIQDFAFVQGRHVRLDTPVLVPSQVQDHVSRILSTAYAEASFVGVHHKRAKSINLGIVKRCNTDYSENNMGFGEARVLYLVNALETAPDRSFFVVEEPETALHEQAQYLFSQYLIDVVNRKRHQLLITTHSRTVTQAFPNEAQLLALRDDSGARLIPQVSAAYVGAILSSDRRNGLLIAVEDDLAKLLVIEILRSKAPDLLRVVEVYSLGNTDDVGTGVGLLTRAGIRSIGVRDADIGADPSKHLYCLPGHTAPEKELLESATVQQDLRAQYAFDASAFLAIHRNVNHHDWFSAIGTEVRVPEDALRVEVVRSYVGALSLDTCEDLISAIRDELGMSIMR